MIGDPACNFCCRFVCLLPESRPMRLTATVLAGAPALLNAVDERELMLRGLKIPAIENLGVTQVSKAPTVGRARVPSLRAVSTGQVRGAGSDRQ